jgi:hypothetical protein
LPIAFSAVSSQNMQRISIWQSLQDVHAVVIESPMYAALTELRSQAGTYVYAVVHAHTARMLDGTSNAEPGTTQPVDSERFATQRENASEDVVSRSLIAMMEFSNGFEFCLLVLIPVAASWLVICNVFRNVVHTIKLAVKLVLTYFLAVYFRSCIKASLKHFEL